MKKTQDNYNKKKITVAWNKKADLPNQRCPKCGSNTYTEFANIERAYDIRFEKRYCVDYTGESKLPTIKIVGIP